MNRVMCHLVAHYPDPERSLAAAEALAEGGASYLEIQFPFSDPAADGPLIQDACTRALEAGFSVKEGFRFIEETLRRVPGMPIFLMTYGSLAVRRGVEEFIRRAVDAGVRGVIVPDLPFDYDEGLYETGKKLGIAVVPVLVPGTAKHRLDAVKSMGPEFLYAALRSGITGTRTELGHENLSFLEGLQGWGAKIFAGFGIATSEQVRMLMPHVEAAVVGSHLVGLIKDNTTRPFEEFRRILARAVKDLVG